MKPSLSPLSWLRWLVIVSVVPAWAVTAWVIASSYVHERDTLIASTTGTARALMRAVERELAGAQATLDVAACALPMKNCCSFSASSMGQIPSSSIVPSVDTRTVIERGSRCRG